MIENDSDLSPKIARKFSCKLCNYSTSKLFDYKKHLSTDKHQKKRNDSKLVENDSDLSQKVAELYKCECGRMYKYDSGYYRHKKECKLNISSCEKPSDDKKLSAIDKDELIISLLKQNSELLEIVKNGTHNTVNTTHTNSHNKAFNLNFFLNETCKNAMNITEFVDSIKLQLTDLMEVGELGYVEGISKIIVKNLNNLDETVRPIHCTDKKRETMYVKDEGHWEKEDDNKTRLKKVINKVVDKNIRLLPQFREKYPEYRNSSSKISDVHDKLVIEVMETDDDKKDKIITNISKSTSISNKGL
jgi:hypothetical protein